MKPLFLLTLCFALSACGGGGGGSDPTKPSDPPSVPTPTPAPVTPTPEQPPIETKISFIEHAGFTNNQLVKIGDISKSKNASINKLVQFNDGQSIIVGQYLASDDYKDSKGFFALMDKEQNVLRQEVVSGGFADICIHDSGEYSLARYVENSADSSQGKEFALQLEKYTRAGELVHKTLLTDPYSENYYLPPFTKEEYLVSEFTLKENTRPPAPNHKVTFTNFINYSSHIGNVELHCQQEKLLVSYNYEGLKLSLFDENYAQQWSQVVSIWDYYVGSFGGLSHIAVDEQGHIFTLSSRNMNSLAAYNHRFGTKFTPDLDRLLDTHIVLKRYNFAGELEFETLLDSGESDVIADALIKANTLYVGANSRRDKFPSGNNYTTEWDISFYRVNLADRTYIHDFLDLNKEDLLRGLSWLNQDLYLYGINGFTQVDSNSWLSAGDGFYKVLPQGQLLDPKSFVNIAGTRNTYINSVGLLDDKLIAAGRTDGPLTHDTDDTSSAMIYKQQ
ncbi:hypothetical protein Q4519_14300 [Motilimonas sp. 1_MG-2023]|uniref:hypothetical protein n=1 Tax=Motilimonas sp. 1_MG-2023 TaxID=3062672 RepID=UPI0026E21D6C|nr:hypothetical protein [Motilimonas sp. 1_MG-2023]MDO6526856.1 hypothetical protein [Motilimonas sp. 1_MG-2023]